MSWFSKDIWRFVRGHDKPRLVGVVIAIDPFQVVYSIYRYIQFKLPQKWLGLGRGISSQLWGFLVCEAVDQLENTNWLRFQQRAVISSPWLVRVDGGSRNQQKQEFITFHGRSTSKEGFGSPKNAQQKHKKHDAFRCWNRSWKSACPETRDPENRPELCTARLVSSVTGKSNLIHCASTKIGLKKEAVSTLIPQTRMFFQPKNLGTLVFDQETTKCYQKMTRSSIRTKLSGSRIAWIFFGGG